MRFLIFKKVLILIISILVFSNSHANEVYYEDWSGIYYLKHVYENRKIKHPDFRHFSGETDYILISTWKGKLIFQARLKTMKPLRYGYFDSEIKEPYKSKQTLIEEDCKVDIKLEGYKLYVWMHSILKCNSALNISGEYIMYNKSE